MTNYEFVKWMAGYFTLSDAETLSKKQFWVMNNHLNLVTAVEGVLGPFNQEIRAMIVHQIDQLEHDDDYSPAEFTTALREKILTQAENI